MRGCEVGGFGSAGVSIGAKGFAGAGSVLCALSLFEKQQSGDYVTLADGEEG
jgi:hypothetical protein